jgi:alkylresorcinol/alkylpyrone synthase
MSEVTIIGLATGTPPKSFPQDELFKMAGYDAFPEATRRKFRALFRVSGVERRAMFLESDSRPSGDPDDFDARYIAGLRALAPPVASEAIRRAGLTPADIDFVVFCSCTGYTCPGFSVELARELGVPDDRPTASFLGMGCSAFVPSLERAWDRVAARPGSRALVVAAEICSSTYFIDEDPESCVGNAIFADGAAAAVLSSATGDAIRARRASLDGGGGGAIPSIEGFRTLRDPRYIDDMGFTRRGGRLRVRLAREIPERILPLVLENLKRLELPSGALLAVHPGGRKILDDLAAAAPGLVPMIAASRAVLRDHGNMSSPTVAFVLERLLAGRPARAGEVGALLTMGPGLSVESMRFTWK